MYRVSCTCTCGTVQHKRYQEMLAQPLMSVVNRAINRVRRRAIS